MGGVRGDWLGLLASPPKGKKLSFEELGDDLEEETLPPINLSKKEMSVVLGEDLLEDSTSSE